MKKCIKCLTEKDLESFCKDKSRKDGRNNRCRKCTRIYKMYHYSKHRERILAEHKEHYKATCIETRDIRIERNRAYRKAHPEVAAAYVKRNRARFNAYNSKQRAAKLKATPKWVNEFFVNEIYHLSRLRTKVTGFEWHVDHIVPLKNKLVCGLHVEHNLQVIPAIENIKKNNTFKI